VPLAQYRAKNLGDQDPAGYQREGINRCIGDDGFDKNSRVFFEVRYLREVKKKDGKNSS
jgi:hypothetical protein